MKFYSYILILEQGKHGGVLILEIHRKINRKPIGQPVQLLWKTFMIGYLEIPSTTTCSKIKIYV